MTSPHVATHISFPEGDILNMKVTLRVAAGFYAGGTFVLSLRVRGRAVALSCPSRGRHPQSDAAKVSKNGLRLVEFGRRPVRRRGAISRPRGGSRPVRRRGAIGRPRGDRGDVAGRGPDHPSGRIAAPPRGAGRIVRRGGSRRRRGARAGSSAGRSRRRDAEPDRDGRRRRCRRTIRSARPRCTR